MTIEEIEKAVERLSPDELARFRAWYEKFAADRFDEALNRDTQAGRLDSFAEEALTAYRGGQTRDL